MINAQLIRKELEGVRKGMKGAVVQRFAEHYGVSRDTIYRYLRKEYGPQKTVKREKRIDDELIDEIGRMKLKGMKLGMSEREISTEMCIMILQSRAVPGSENLTVSTVNRRLKEKGFRQRDAIVRVEAEYANQQHQLDFSRSKYFNLHKRDGDDFILRVSKVLSYKEEEKKLRLWLGGIVDSYSRLAVVRAYPATGESAVLGLNILRWAYNREEDELPLRYLPEILKFDNGPLDNKSTDQLLEQLGIKKELVIPYKKRGIQKQESVWKLVWRRFELPLALELGEGGTIRLSDYNDLLHEFMINNAAAAHPVKNGTKGHVYKASLTAHPPRVLENDIAEVLFRTWRRKVKQDLTVSITYKGDRVILEAPLYAMDKWINVYVNYAGEFVGELADEYHKPFVLKVTEGSVNLGDFEHRQHSGYKAGLERDIKEEEKAKINYLPTRETKTEVTTKFTEAEYDDSYSFANEYEAKVYIGKQFRNGSYADVAYIFDDILKEKDGLKKKEIDEIIRLIKNQQATG